MEVEGLSLNTKPKQVQSAAPIAFLLDCIANLQHGRWTRNCPQNIRRIVIE